MRNNIITVTLLALLPVISGCLAVAAGGVAAGVMVAEDRRTVGTMTEDQGIELRAASRSPGKGQGCAHQHHQLQPRGAADR